MARFRLGFDEHFFELDRDPVHLKKMWYVVGASMYCYSTHRPTRRGDEANMWSGQESLVKIIKQCLQSQHHISQKKSSKVLSICNQRLAMQLAEYNLSIQKWEREIPDQLTDRYADHFARGFFDVFPLRTVALGSDYKGGIGVNRRYAILEDILLLLARKRDIQFHKRKRRPYGHYVIDRDDAQKIPEYLYQDWKFIEEQRLYIPSKLDQWVQLTDLPDPRTGDRTSL